VPVMEAAAVAGRMARARRLGADVAEWHTAGVQFAAGLCLALVGRDHGPQLRAHHNDASGSSQSISACFQRNAGTVSVLG